MIYLLYELAKSSDLQTRMCEELSTVKSAKDGVLEYQDVQHLPLLRAVINETLRRHPAIVGVLPRITEADMVIEGVAVPRGVCCSLATRSPGPHYVLDFSRLKISFDASEQKKLTIS